MELARRSGEQRFGGVPRAAGEPQGLCPLCRRLGRALLRRDREGNRGPDGEKGRDPLHCARRTRARTR